MIEVEKKFKLSPRDREKLLEGTEFLSKNVFTDIYYDTQDWKLTSQDIWLRSRLGKFEMKVPVRLESNNSSIDQYEELQNDDQIREKLSLQLNKDLEQDLQDAGYAPFCKCETERSKYKKGEFIIDLDNVNYGDWKYELGEIELLVDLPQDIPSAEQKIIDYAQSCGLEILPVRGKVIEYLKKKKPQHFNALLKAGVIKEV